MGPSGDLDNRLDAVELVIGTPLPGKDSVLARLAAVEQKSKEIDARFRGIEYTLGRLAAVEDRLLMVELVIGTPLPKEGELTLLARLATVENKVRELLPDFTPSKSPAPPAPILEWYSEAGFIHCPKCRTIHLLRRDGLGLHPGDPCPRCVPPKPDIPILKRTAFWGDLICSQCKSHFPFTEHESLYHPGDPCPECTKKGGE